MSDELAVVDAEGTPLEMFSGRQMADLIVKYKVLQDALDRSMPDQIMAIGEKRFRKKGYWRAVAVAFKLTVEPTAERREVQGQFQDGTDNLGWIVTYRATAPNGRSASGDGACFAIEKAARFKCPHPHGTWAGKSLHFPATACPDYSPDYAWQTRPLDASEHNVRSHAHTRAFNRAVSNLVGFGEVSAEEADFRNEVALATAAPSPRSPQPPDPFEPPPPPLFDEDGDEDARPGEPTISVPQAKRLWAIGRAKGWSSGGLKIFLAQLGYEHGTEVPRRIYNKLVERIETEAPR